MFLYFIVILLQVCVISDPVEETIECLDICEKWFFHAIKMPVLYLNALMMYLKSWNGGVGGEKRERERENIVMK